METSLNLDDLQQSVANPPNILQLCGSKSLGGLELHFVNFSKWLRDFMPNNIWVAVREGTRLSQTITSDVALNGRFVNQIKQLIRFMTNHQINILHVHDKNDLLLAVLAKKFSPRAIKLVHTRHMQINGSKKDPYHRFIYTNIDQLITVTQEMKHRAEKYLPIPKASIHQTYLGVGPMPSLSLADRQAFRTSLGIDKNTFVCANIARIEQQKGQHVLVQAIKKIHQHIPVHAIFIGEPMDSDYSERLQSSSQALPISWLGFRQDIPKLIQAADCIIITTENETFGLIAVESMLCERLTIAADSGGLKEIIHHGHNGLMYRTFDPDDLASTIRYSYENPEWCQQLAHTGMLDANNRFDERRQFQSLLTSMIKACHA